jgi:hypothetical protein
MMRLTITMRSVAFYVCLLSISLVEGDINVFLRQMERLDEEMSPWRISVPNPLNPKAPIKTFLAKPEAKKLSQEEDWSAIESQHNKLKKLAEDDAKIKHPPPKVTTPSEEVKLDNTKTTEIKVRKPGCPIKAAPTGEPSEEQKVRFSKLIETLGLTGNVRPWKAPIYNSLCHVLPPQAGLTEEDKDLWAFIVVHWPVIYQYLDLKDSKKGPRDYILNAFEHILLAESGTEHEYLLVAIRNPDTKFELKYDNGAQFTTPSGVIDYLSVLVNDMLKIEANREKVLCPVMENYGLECGDFLKKIQNIWSLESIIKEGLSYTLIDLVKEKLTQAWDFGKNPLKKVTFLKLRILFEMLNKDLTNELVFIILWTSVKSEYWKIVPAESSVLVAHVFCEAICDATGNGPVTRECLFFKSLDPGKLSKTITNLIPTSTVLMNPPLPSETDFRIPDFSKEWQEIMEEVWRELQSWDEIEIQQAALRALDMNKANIPKPSHQTFKAFIRELIALNFADKHGEAVAKFLTGDKGEIIKAMREDSPKGSARLYVETDPYDLIFVSYDVLDTLAHEPKYNSNSVLFLLSQSSLLPETLGPHETALYEEVHTLFKEGLKKCSEKELAFPSELGSPPDLTNPSVPWHLFRWNRSIGGRHRLNTCSGFKSALIFLKKEMLNDAWEEYLRKLATLHHLDFNPELYPAFTSNTSALLAQSGYKALADLQKEHPKCGPGVDKFFARSELDLDKIGIIRRATSSIQVLYMTFYQYLDDALADTIEDGKRQVNRAVLKVFKENCCETREDEINYYYTSECISPSHSYLASWRAKDDNCAQVLRSTDCEALRGALDHIYQSGSLYKECIKSKRRQYLQNNNDFMRCIKQFNPSLELKDENKPCASSLAGNFKVEPEKH